MRLTRKQFLSAAASGTVLVLLQGCGGGGEHEVLESHDGFLP